jgi:hypothetical protein
VAGGTRLRPVGRAADRPQRADRGGAQEAPRARLASGGVRDRSTAADRAAAGDRSRQRDPWRRGLVHARARARCRCASAPPRRSCDWSGTYSVTWRRLRTPAGRHHRDDRGRHRSVGAQPAPGGARAGRLVQYRHRGHGRPWRGHAVPGAIRDHARRGAAAGAGQPARPGPRAAGRRGRPGETSLAGHLDRDAGRRAAASHGLSHRRAATATASAGDRGPGPPRRRVPRIRAGRGG